MPLALFRATSNQPELVVKNNAIKLPPGLDVQMVKDLIEHLKELTTWKRYAKKLQSYESTYKDVQICSAADFLGMTIYTQHIFNWYWARIRSGDLPGYGDIDAFTAVNTPLGSKVFGKVVNLLAKLDFEDNIPDPENFGAYLESNERFRTALGDAKKKMRNHHDYLAHRNRREAVVAMEKSEDAEERMLRAKEVEEKTAKHLAMWNAEKKKESEVRERVQAKLAQPGKKIWRPDGASYLRRVHGKNVPI
ncbi:hypothetical protein BDW02DRAFT_19701 [Decorospora gaudefroyi]|uniref:Uncharacterized protein n=1 Tax=Decorospora gaudefroyi TaxID=184978 RepID=A0A6A5K867_9PLEO|nr:hypothetical protein BDW02DRAFT_19701 [Decorospora gaudefroyi]